MSAKVDRVKCICAECGMEFERLPSQLKRGRGKYCSRRCLALSKIEHLNATRKPTSSNSGWFTTDRVSGEKSINWVEPIERICENCGNKFYRKKWVLNQKSNKGRFCSTKCRDTYKALYQSGENSSYYVGGKTVYHGSTWRSIRKVVVKEQNGICADCGKYIGDRLPVHHIKPFRYFQDEQSANQLENLIGLCQSCHMKREYS